MSRTLRKLDAIDALNHVGANAIQDEMLHQIHQEYLSSLKQLTAECMQHIDEQKTAFAVLIKLNEFLDNKSQLSEETIEHFFHYLLDNDFANLQLLENDNSKSMKKFIKELGIIAAITFTGTTPGSVISAAIYTATRHSVFEFFKPHQREKELSDKLTLRDRCP